MNCVYCKIEINPLRLKALPNTKTCVDCSTTGAKRCAITTHGEKDHTWNDLAIMEPEEFERYERSMMNEKKTLKTPHTKPEFLDFEQEENNLTDKDFDLETE